MSTEQMRWLLKVIQPERTLASLPGGAGLSQETHAAVLGLPPEVYAAELSRMRAEAKEAAQDEQVKHIGTKKLNSEKQT